MNCLTLRGAKDITSAFRLRMPLYCDLGYIPSAEWRSTSIDMLMLLLMRYVYSHFCPLGDDPAHLWLGLGSLVLKWAHLACARFKARPWMLLWILLNCCWSFHCEVLYATGPKVSNKGGQEGEWPWTPTQQGPHPTPVPSWVQLLFVRWRKTLIGYISSLKDQILHCLSLTRSADTLP